MGVHSSQGKGELGALFKKHHQRVTFTYKFNEILLTAVEVKICLLAI